MGLYIMHLIMMKNPTFQRLVPIRIHNGYLYLMAFIIAVFAFLNTLSNGFVFDDDLFIVKSPFIQDWRNLFSLFTSDYLRHSWENLDVNRPVMVISLIFDFSVWKLNPLGYHLTNLVLHAANSLALLYLLSLIFSDVRIPFLSTVLFAIHPVHIQAVNAINFREDLLVTFFYLASLSYFIRGVNNYKWSPLLSALFYLFALLSKEMALTLPIICFLYLRVWGRRNPPRWMFTGQILVTALYILFYLYVRQFSGVQVFYEESIIERLYGAIVIISRYIWIHLFPIRLLADYDDRLFFLFNFKN